VSTQLHLNINNNNKIKRTTVTADGKPRNSSRGLFKEFKICMS
jgi:hypothetical protein